MGSASALAASLMGVLMIPTPGHEIDESRGSFESRGKVIGLERYEPKRPGRHPSVLILHGSGGLEAGGDDYRVLARDLAGRGYVAQVVHYFEQTGTVQADLATIGRSFSSWMLTVGDAIGAVGRQENVDPGRIGLLGFSLGSYLALSVAGHDLRVAAVVEYFGSLPDVFTWNLKRFPPTLILHGEDDPVVTVESARKLERLFQARKFPYEIRIYPGQGHRFQGPAERDSVRLSLEFLAKHLGPS